MRCILAAIVTYVVRSAFRTPTRYGTCACAHLNHISYVAPQKKGKKK